MEIGSSCQKRRSSGGWSSIQEGANEAQSLADTRFGQDYFPLPKEIFSLGLSAAEIAIYAYLLFCEDRQTFQCWPSYRKIGEAVGLSPNTICKHIRSLEERDLLVTEPTQVTTKDGRKRNGNLLFTIRPIQFALQQDYDRQMQKLTEDAARRKYADFIENTG